MTLIVTFFTFVTYLEENETIIVNFKEIDILNMKRLNDIIVLVGEAVAAMLWLEDDAELIPCRVNRERITIE